MAGPTLSGQPRTVYHPTAPTARPNEVTGAGSYYHRGGLIATAASNQSTEQAFFLDPAEWAVYQRRMEWYLDYWLMTPSVSPATSITIGLNAVTGRGVGAANGTAPLTVGAAVPGSLGPTTALVAGMTEHHETPAFELSSAGVYVLRADFTAAIAANSSVVILYRLAVTAQ